MTFQRTALVLSTVLAFTAVASEGPTANNVGLDPSLRGPGALDDRSPQHRPQLISVFLGIPAWYGGYGGFPFSVGGRFFQPILHDGLIPEANDSIGIEVGADFLGIGARPFAGLFSIPIELMWAFHFTPRLAAYVKLGVALEIRFTSWCWGGVCGTGAAAGPIADLGVWFKATDSIYLRLELGYPGVKLGVGFPLL